MNKAVIIFILSISFFTTYAQNSDGHVLLSDRNHWTVAYYVSIPGKWELANNSVKMFKPGGGISNRTEDMLLIGKNFFFEPEARLFVDNYRYDNITIGERSPYEPAKTYDHPVRKIGLRLPLTVGDKLDIFKRGSLFFSTGPESEFGISARTKVNEDQIGIFEEDMYKALMRRFDVSWDIRAAIIINRFRIDLTGSFGMLDIIKTDDSMHESRISVGLGYVC